MAARRRRRAAREAALWGAGAVALIAALVLALAWPLLSQADSPKPAPEGVQDKLRHAWTYYWIGIAERGDLRSFETGLRYVEQAKALAKEQAKAQAKGQAGADPEVEGAIERVEVALKEQVGLAGITLRGNFPLISFLGPSIFIDAVSMGTYEITDEPYDAAVTQMSESLRDEVMAQWSIPVQTDVLVISSPPNRTFEAKANLLIARSPKINVVPLNSLHGRLPAPVIQALEQGRLDELKADLAGLLQAERLLLINVVEIDQVDDVYFYEFQALLLTPGQAPTAHKALVKRALVRDRRPRQWPLVWTIAAMLLLGVAAVVVATRERVAPWEAAALGGLAALTGIVSPHILLKFLEAVEPHAEELVKLAFWWPILAAWVVLVGPLVVASTLINRLSASSLLLKRASEHSPHVALAAGAGAGAYLSRGPLVYDVEWGWLLAWSMALGAVGVARTLALIRAHQRVTAPQHVLLIASLVGMPLAFFAWSLPWTLLTSALALGASAPWWSRASGLAVGQVGLAHGQAGLDLGQPAMEQAALDALVERARKPPYRVYSPYQQALERVQRALDEEGQICRVTWIMLQGQKGSGKTATSAALVEALRQGAVVLHGVCSPPSNEDLEGDGDGHEVKPYEVFAQAFGDASAFGLADLEHDVLSELEGTVFDAIPIVSMLLPAGGEQGRAVSDRGELYTRIERELVRKTKKGARPVILWLDDVQWLDNASQGLLGHLLERFPEGSPRPIVFVLGGRALPVNSPLSERHQRQLREMMVSVELGAAERQRLLIEAVGFDERSAQRLDEAVSEGEGKANMAWLLTLVEAVARSGAVVHDEQGTYRLTVEDAERLPIPDSFKKMVGKTYEQLASQERELMRAAACMGSSFSVEVLSRVTRRERLAVLDGLERIADSTHLIEDHQAADDLYQFVSAQRYVALRDHLRLQDMHPKVQAPQLLRDLHLEIAQHMEQLWQSQQADVSAVAHHYYHAGRRDLPKALRFCELAARAALDVFAYDNAEFQLRRAITCAEMLAVSAGPVESRHEAQRRVAQLELELRLLPYDRAHVLGLGELSAQNAQAAMALFEPWRRGQAPQPPLALLIRMARACYDARRFEDAIQIAQALDALDEPEGSSDVEPSALVERRIARVEGLHFIGLSLDPRGQAKERLAHLELAASAVEAILALELTERERQEVLALKGRLSNSLGEQLSQPMTYDFARAKACFDQSVAIKSSLRPEDKPGLARALGGLGRLFLYSLDQPAPRVDGLDAAQRLALARERFEQDLSMCQDYGDIAGQCQMHSHLGDCAMRQGRMEDAATHYQTSIQLAASSVNLAFALIGLLRVRDAQADAQGAVQAGQRLVELVLGGGLPGFLSPHIAKALQECHIDSDLVQGFDEAMSKISPPQPQPRPEPASQEPAPEQALKQAPKQAPRGAAVEADASVAPEAPVSQASEGPDDEPRVEQPRVKEASDEEASDEEASDEEAGDEEAGDEEE